jgi:hypothetical protein
LSIRSIVKSGAIVPRSNKFANPFYSLLLVAGIAFALTATTYGVMAFREARPAATEVEQAESVPVHPLMAWMSRNGEAALISELVFLAIFHRGCDRYGRLLATPRCGSAKKVTRCK